MRRIATQKAQFGFQGIRVTTEVRPTDAPDMAVGSVGNSLRVLDPEVGGPMSPRTALSTSCNHDVALATGIFNQVYCSFGLASRFGLPACRRRLCGLTHAN
jgi:hypothetical protein